MHRTRTTRTVTAMALGAAVGCGLVLATAATASAHVHVAPDSTTSGGSSHLTFTVPTESDTASTTKVSIQLPQDHPFLSVRPRALAGWTVTVIEAALPTPVTVKGTELTKAPRTVTWTARDGGVGPGQYQDFTVQVGPLPAPGELTLPAVQTYSDGSVVRWDQPTPASGTEPEHPAPTFTVTGDSQVHASDVAAGAAAHEGGGAGTWLAGGALVIAIGAAAAAGTAWRATRS